jgi:hypothetical protein
MAGFGSKLLFFTRHPSESWDLPQYRTTKLWAIPAFAGMTCSDCGRSPPELVASKGVHLKQSTFHPYDFV